MRAHLQTLSILLLSIGCCRGQGTETAVYNKEFKWKIDVPAGFESVPSDQWMKMQNRGANTIEQTYDAKVENRAKTIFVFRSDQFNYFESNYQPFDTAVDGNYLESCQNVNRILYGTFEAQMPNVKMDSASSQETIDGKQFQVFRINIFLNSKVKMECLMYSRLFEKKEFAVNILTVDEDRRRALLAAWRHSTFATE